MNPRDPIRRLLYEGRNWLGGHRLLFPALRLDRRLRTRIVTSSTDVCLEGFPRSANTYLSYIFERWNPGVRMAHHVHVPMQVRRAVALGVPCAVLVREPLDAVAALQVMDRGRLADGVVYRSYISFYERLLDVRDQVLVCRFEDVIADPGGVVEALNRRYGTTFRSEPVTAEVDAWFKQRVAVVGERFGFGGVAVGVPTEEKERLKATARERLARHPLLGRAEAVYRLWTDDAPGRGGRRAT